MAEALWSAGRGLGCGLGIAGGVVGLAGAGASGAAALGLVPVDALTLVAVAGGTFAGLGLVLVLWGGSVFAATGGGRGGSARSGATLSSPEQE
jgi:hypothetical protein